MKHKPREKEEKHCGVLDCKNIAVRSLSAKKVKSTLPDLKLGDSGKRVPLCKEHYKQFKKKTKEERKLESLSWK